MKSGTMKTLYAAILALSPLVSEADCILAWDYDDEWAASAITGFKAYQSGVEIGTIPGIARETPCESINAAPGIPIHLTAYAANIESDPSNEVTIGLPEVMQLRFEFRFEVIVP
jgi:hypothetical protein